MSTISKHLFVALMGVILLASCSRPVAYFQRTPTERFHSPKPETVAVTPSTETVTEQSTVTIPATEVPATPAEQVAQTKQAMSQLEAYVRNDSKLASNKKLTKRIAHVNELLVAASDKAALSTNAASAKKTTLLERAMLKKIDKKIKNHVSPEKTNYLNKNTKNGIIIGAIGLILSLIFGGVLGVIGLVLLIVGIVLILLGVLQ